MAHYEVSNKFGIQELYQLRCTDTHLEFIVREEDWSRIVILLSQYRTEEGSKFTTPSLSGEPWGFNCCSTVGCKNRRVTISVPTTLVSGNNKNPIVGLQASACTIEILTNVLFVLLCEQQECEYGGASQLFHLDTCVGEGLHGASFELTVSHRARLVLASMGEEYILKDAIERMHQHYAALYQNTSARNHKPDLDVYICQRGVIHMHTFGNCACLGTSPDSFEDEDGCTLSSHNVDTIVQQMNLLVGVASIWQTVQDSLMK